MGSKQDENEYNLWLAMGMNRRERFLVFIEEKGEVVRRIFIPEGPWVGGWWRMMVVLFEMVERKFEPLDKSKEVKIDVQKQVQS